MGFAHHRVFLAQWLSIRVWNPKVWGSVPHGTQNFFFWSHTWDKIKKYLLQCHEQYFFLTVLSRVKDFLPVMREAELALEQELQVKSPTELDIESVDDGAPFIEMVSTTLYTLTSECIFFLLSSITFLRCWQGEFVEKSEAALVGDHSLDLDIWFRDDIVRRNKM